jgi:hypothetical protein
MFFIVIFNAMNQSRANDTVKNRSVSKEGNEDER